MYLPKKNPSEASTLSHDLALTKAKVTKAKVATNTLPHWQCFNTSCILPWTNTCNQKTARLGRMAAHFVIALRPKCHGILYLSPANSGVNYKIEKQKHVFQRVGHAATTQRCWFVGSSSKKRSNLCASNLDEPI